MLVLMQVVLGGGQEAMEVTTTSTKVGKFDARFFHLVFEEEFGRVKGHFGPINTVAFHPDGKRYCDVPCLSHVSRWMEIVAVLLRHIVRAFHNPRV